MSATPDIAVPVPAALAAGDRHALSGFDRTALDALVPKLAAIGLRIERRRTGWRIARPATAATTC